MSETEERQATLAASAAVAHYFAGRRDESKQFDDIVDDIVKLSVAAALSVDRPRVNEDAMRSFERLMDKLTRGKLTNELLDDARAVRLELAGRAPLASSQLLESLVELLRSRKAAASVMELVKGHGWVPTSVRPGGHPRTAASQHKYCPRHGANAEHRLYKNGKRKPDGEIDYAWRCIPCMNDARGGLKARRQQAEQSALTRSHGADSLAT